MALVQVAAHARHALGHERLGAELLEQVEERALDRIGRGEAAVQRGVGAREPQREAVGRAAKGLEVVLVGVRVQVRCPPRQRFAPAVQAMPAEVQVALA